MKLVARHSSRFVLLTEQEMCGCDFYFKEELLTCDKKNLIFSKKKKLSRLSFCFFFSSEQLVVLFSFLEYLEFERKLLLVCEVLS